MERLKKEAVETLFGAVVCGAFVGAMMIAVLWFYPY